MSNIFFRGAGAWGQYRLWPRSLRWRLQLWQGFLFLSMLTGFGATVYQLQRINRFRQVDAGLETRVTALSRTLRDIYRHGPGGPPPPPGGNDLGVPDGQRRPPYDAHFGGPPPPDRPPSHVPLSSETAALFAPGAGGYYFTIWYRDGTVVNRSDNSPVDSPAPTPSERDTLPHFRTRGLFREAVHCSGFGDCAMAGRSIETDLKASQTFAWTLLAAGATVLALGFGLGWWLISRAIRPVEQISAAATLIAGGNLSERIKIADADDELGRLAAVLNSTFGRLESAFVRQRQFTSDAAHELRTPLAILISEAQTTLAKERTAAEYRETIEGGLETAQEMRKLTEVLLELARFDAGDEQPSREDVNLAEVTSRCIERLGTLATQNGITIHPDLAPAFAFILRERLEIVIANLLTNAIHYNKPEGSVRIATYSEDAMAVLTVSDTGIGLAPEDLPRIFDRFYRADKARSRADGHAGLGLAICKTIVEAERGTIEVFSRGQEGTTFTVRIPNGRMRPSA